MIELILGLLLGTGAGLLSAIPGVHTSVLLIGLLPLLGIKGSLGAVALTSAIGSGVIAGSLAKTFHPATSTTLASATPEQVMAYRGDGIRAVWIQIQASWTGLLVVGLAAVPLLLLRLLSEEDVENLFKVLGGFSPLLIVTFLVVTTWTARKRVVTALVLVLSALVGFVGMNVPALAGNPMVLSPLLAGIFSIPALGMVVFEHGHTVPIPRQQPLRSTRGVASPLQYHGAWAGILTALVAGLGSGSAVSLFAERVKPEEYLGMHTASETSNNAFALLSFILVGTAHSGTGVALKMGSSSPSLVFGLFLMAAVLVGLVASSAVIMRVAPGYSRVISHLNPRVVATLVLAFTVTLVAVETGPAGLMVAAVATLLGLAAKLHFAPNQALLAVLAGPVLLYHTGLSGPVAGLLGVLR